MSESKLKVTIISIIKQLIYVVVFTFFITVMVVQTYHINDVSMKPTFDAHGNRVLVFLTPYLFQTEPGFAQILVIDSRVDRKRSFKDKFVESPIIQLLTGNEPEHLWVKRVIGLPGDRLVYNNGTIYRNGYPLEEEYLAEEMVRGFSSITVPEGHIFVLGDNRNYSNDSRIVGPVPLENIQGRVFVRFFPLSKAATF